MSKIGTESKKRGDAYFHGWLYSFFLDPRMVPIRDRVSDCIPEGSSVVDIGCGTGAQLFALSKKIKRGLGVDSSPAQINQALRQKAKLGTDHIEFSSSDATRLNSIEDGEFDFAMSSMVIHEMPEEIRLPVLKEMRRIARQLIVVDWDVPQSTLSRKIGTHIIERFAGREHYRGFCSFNKSGGMPALFETLGLTVIDEQVTAQRTIRLWRCE